MTKILFLNSNRADHRVIFKLFLQLDYQVDHASNKEELIQKLQSDRFNAVVFWPVPADKVDQIVEIIRNNNPVLTVLVVSGGARKTKGGNIVFCREDSAEILFCVEQLLNENEERFNPEIMGMEIRMESQRVEYREKKLMHLISERLKRYAAEKYLKNENF